MIDFIVSTMHFYKQGVNEPNSLLGLGRLGDADQFRSNVRKMLSNWGPSRVQKARKRKALTIMS